MTVNPPAPATPGAIAGTIPVCPGVTGLTYTIAAVPKCNFIYLGCSNRMDSN
jgi:hypothetical protein